MFEREDDLVNAFSEKTEKFLSLLTKRQTGKRFLIHEFDSKFGIADLILGTTNKSFANQIKRPAININWVYPLDSLEKIGHFSEKDFRDKFSLTAQSAKKRLKEYETAGFLFHNQDDTYFVSQPYQSVTDLVVSIEAKLKDWKRALIQASRYKRFSDYSFVLLDEHFSRPAIENIERFKDTNIGLIVMSDRKFKILFKPIRNERKMREYSLRLDEFIFSQLKENALKSY